MSQSPVYDPFTRGPWPVGVRTIHALDAARDRQFRCEIWYPAAARHLGEDLSPATQDQFAAPPLNAPRRQAAVRDAVAGPGTYPLIIYSHASLQHRRSATFLCTHLSSHGYVVAGLDHTEVVAKLFRKEGETEPQKQARWHQIMSSRVPDVRFLLDHLLETTGSAETKLDPSRIGIVGHSLGGWTALAAADADRRIRTVVALAPGGSSNPKPGILPVTLSFRSDWNIPTLFLVAENDTSLPLDGMYEIFKRTPSAKQMLILRRADHLHFVDEVEELHEAVRKMPASGDLAALQKEMRPMAELCSGEQAHLFVRGLTLSHMDASLRQNDEAWRVAGGGWRMAGKGFDVIEHRPR
jgi:predicted dienelactone hydrolase